MLFKFLLPLIDRNTKEMITWFKRDGFCPISTNGTHSDLIKGVGEENSKIMIIADIIEPTLVEWVKASIGGGLIVEIEADMIL